MNKYTLKELAYSFLGLKNRYELKQAIKNLQKALPEQTIVELPTDEDIDKVPEYDDGGNIRDYSLTIFAKLSDYADAMDDEDYI